MPLKMFSVKGFADGKGAAQYFGFAAAVIVAINIAAIVAVNKARREQRRTANLRHRRTPEGRLDQRDRQQAYRQRLAAVSVMDQGSHNEVSAANYHPAGNFPSGCRLHGQQNQRDSCFRSALLLLSAVGQAGL